jgi:pyridoxamine 5'-phosphate oxidase
VTITLVFQLATVAGHDPRVRSHVFRSFLSERVRAHRPLLVSTTDIRTPKAAQIVDNPSVELAWWFRATQEQFRVVGKGVLIPHPAHPFYDAARAAGVVEGFDWEAKRREVFDEMGAHMKASWCSPVPGTPLGWDGHNWPTALPMLAEATSESDRQNVEMALTNFALLLIDPQEVDYVELGVMPNRRTRFVLGPNGWEETALVP